MTVTFELFFDDGAPLAFEWDANKAATNLKDHGIRFEEAAYIFLDDPLTAEDDSARGEMREITIGRLAAGLDGDVIVVVVHTERNGVIRLISARKATAHERKRFYVHLKATYC